MTHSHGPITHRKMGGSRLLGTLLPFQWLLKYCYGLNCVPPDSYVEALTHNVTVSGDRVFGR